MSVVLVVVVYKALHPLLSFLSIVEAVTGVQVIAAILKRTEEGLRIRIVVADSRTTVREGNKAKVGAAFMLAPLSECTTSCPGLIPYRLKASPRKRTAKSALSASKTLALTTMRL